MRFLRFIRSLFRGAIYFWSLTRNGDCRWFEVYRPSYWRYRFKPWESDYWKWRMFTIYGPAAQNLNGRKFFKLLWQDWDQVVSLADWVHDMKAES